MLCSRCKYQTEDAEAYIAHLESHMSASGMTNEEAIAAGMGYDRLSGLSDVLDRNRRNPNERIERPSDFGILGQD